MQGRAMIAAAVLAGALTGAGEADAGWVVDQAVQGAAGVSRQQLLIQANRLKTVTLGPDGQPSHAFIADLDGQTLVQVDYRRRQYITATFQEYVQAMSGAAQAAAGQIAQARKAMEQAMKDMPPEQRKAVEQMMRQQMPPGGDPCVEPKREVRKAGPSATIAGYPAARWEVLADGQVESEVWVAPSLPVIREVDARKLEQFGATMSQVGGCGPGGAARGLDPGWKLAAEGFPVRTINSGVTVEVVKAESRTIPAAEFQPPGGFARKTLRDMLGQ